jgi:hypothetical protein
MPGIRHRYILRAAVVLAAGCVARIAKTMGIEPQ